MAHVRPSYLLLLLLGATSFKTPSPHVHIFQRFVVVSSSPFEGSEGVKRDSGKPYIPGLRWPLPKVKQEIEIPEVGEVNSVEVDLAAMVQELKGNANLVDVREKQEFEKAHFTIATHYPLSTLRKGFIPDDPTTGVPYELNRKLYLHCDTGMSAAQVAQVLQTRFGYTDVVPLTGTGFEELAASEIFEELAPIGTKIVASGPGYEFYDNTIGN